MNASAGGTPAPRLALLASAARPLRSLETALHLARHLPVEVWVGVSETALSWLDTEAIQQLAGRPLLNAGEPLSEGRYTVCVAPASSNTLNKLASGIADTLVTAVAAEAIGTGHRVVVAPSMNNALTRHPAIQEGRRRLISYGVDLVWPEGGNERSEDFDAWWTAVMTSCVPPSSQ